MLKLPQGSAKKNETAPQNIGLLIKILTCLIIQLFKEAITAKGTFNLLENINR